MQKVLIIDDSQFDIVILSDILRKYYQVISAKNGEDGLKRSLYEKPHLILLDVVMPGKDGFQVLEELKQEEETKNIPVIMLTGLSDDGMEEKSLLIGAVDYIRKPYNANIVKARVRTQMDLSLYRETIENKLSEDALTGIYNRRYFDTQLESMWNQALRQKTFLTFFLIDIDYFKQVNDTYGHPQGDIVLKQVAREISSYMSDQKNGFVARYGGEEFGLVAFATADEAIVMGEQIRRRIFDLKIPNINSEVADFVTISIGTSTIVPDETSSLQQFIVQADQALYAAKMEGRNKVKTAEPEKDRIQDEEMK